MSQFVNDPVLVELRRAIVLHPDEDTPRLEYADRLDELEPVRVRCPDCCLGLPGYRKETRRDGHYRNVPCPTCAGTNTAGTVIDQSTAAYAAFIRADCDPARRSDPAVAASFADNRERWFLHVYTVRNAANFRTGVFDRSDHYRHPVGLVTRGFVSEIRSDAAAFIGAAGHLFWHPDAPVGCPRCAGHGWIRDDDPVAGASVTVNCPQCGGTAQVAAEFPRTAEPLRRVTLLTEPDLLFQRSVYYPQEPTVALWEYRWLPDPYPFRVVATEVHAAAGGPGHGPPWVWKRYVAVRFPGLTVVRGHSAPPAVVANEIALAAAVSPEPQEPA